MNLEMMNTMESQLSSLKNRRHELADSNFEKGVNLLYQAIDEHFSNKALLNQAWEALAEAHTQHRQDPRPLVAMGFLLWILGDNKLALEYVREAMARDPDDPDALSLLKSMQKIQSEDHAEGQYDKKKRLDNDTLYQKLHRLIDRHIDDLKLFMDQHQPTHQPDTLTQISEKKTYYEKQLDLIAFHIQQLSEAKNTTGLSQNLDQLSINLNYLRDLEQDCQRFNSLKTAIDQALIEAKDLVHQLNQEITAAADISLDHIYDTCDQVADQLDDMIQRGLNVLAIEDEYEFLVTYVQALQERLDF